MGRALRPCHTWTKGFISGSGGNFDTLIDEQFIGRFPFCTILTIDMLSNKISINPNTNRNQTYSARVVLAFPFSCSVSSSLSSKFFPFYAHNCTNEELVTCSAGIGPKCPLCAFWQYSPPPQVWSFLSPYRISWTKTSSGPQGVYWITYSKGPGN